jgi:hypothetical protein
MALDQSLLGPTPKSLQADDLDLAGGEVLLLVHLQMPVSTEHEAVVAVELGGVRHTNWTDLLKGELQQCGSREVLNGFDVSLALALQHAEDRHFAGRSPVPVAFVTASEVGLIELDLSVQPTLGILGLAQARAVLWGS